MASISCFLADFGFLLAALDDLQRAAQFGGAGAAIFFNLLNALAALPQFLAQIARRMHAVLRALRVLRWMLRDFALQRLQFVHRAAQTSARLRRTEVLKRDIADDAGDLHHVARQAIAQAAVLLGLHLARNGLQLLPELLALPVIFFDFGDLGQQFV